jgi:hypothetical protein
VALLLLLLNNLKKEYNPTVPATTAPTTGIAEDTAAVDAIFPENADAVPSDCKKESENTELAKTFVFVLNVLALAFTESNTFFILSFKDFFVEISLDSFVIKMSEKLKSKKEKYNYIFMQFTVSPLEKKQIKAVAEKESYKTTSEFLRRIVFDYIRKQENPELLNCTDDSNLNPIMLESLSKSLREVLKNQEILLQREDAFEQMKEMIANLHKIAETNALVKERDAIIQLLKNHNSLSMEKIQQATNIRQDVIFKILTNMDLFKITSTGNFGLR